MGSKQVVNFATQIPSVTNFHPLRVDLLLERFCQILDKLGNLNLSRGHVKFAIGWAVEVLFGCPDLVISLHDHKLRSFVCNGQMYIFILPKVFQTSFLVK